MDSFRSPQQAVELFHLNFCRVLAAGEHRSHFVVKGGCNLRFFFESIRYSEDLDLDVAMGAPTTLKHRVDKVLGSPAFLVPLRSAGISPQDISAPKQSETTQRWKVGLRVEGMGSALRTKIEFSRRAKPRGVIIEAVARSVASVHGVPPPILAHYGRPEAILQKIRALAGRTEVQARDLFDLHLLFSHGPLAVVLSGEDARTLGIAVARAEALTADAFAAQVLPFLAPDRREEFEGRAAWDAVQQAVLVRLEELRR
jgi:hypothetical protein